MFELKTLKSLSKVFWTEISWNWGNISKKLKYPVWCKHMIQLFLKASMKLILDATDNLGTQDP